MPAQPTTPIVTNTIAERRLQRRDERDEQQQRGKRERDVGEPHHELVDPAGRSSRRRVRASRRA